MLYLLRHAKDDESYIGSWSNIKILESEEEKVKDQATFIKNNIKVPKIYTSDIERAKQTAEIINEQLNVELVIDKNLREQNKGNLTGKLKSSLTKEELYLIEHQQINTEFPEGESLLNLYKRIKSYLENIKLYEDNSLIVTHRGVINMIYYILNDIPLDMDKNKFKVDHLSLHELDIEKMKIRRLK